MDSNIIIALVLVVAGVAGFVVLARTLLDNWKAGSRGKEEADAYQSQRSKAFEECYNDCMIGERWEPDKREACDSVCRSRGDAYPSPSTP